jgi:hypothetical protein
MEGGAGTSHAKKRDENLLRDERILVGDMFVGNRGHPILKLPKTKFS